MPNATPATTGCSMCPGRFNANDPYSQTRISAMCNQHPENCLTCCLGQPNAGKQHLEVWNQQLLNDPERIAMWEQAYGPDWEEKL